MCYCQLLKPHNCAFICSIFSMHKNDAASPQSQYIVQNFSAHVKSMQQLWIQYQYLTPASGSMINERDMWCSISQIWLALPTGLFPLREFPLCQFPLCQFPLCQFPFGQLLTSSIPTQSIPICSMLTKWVLTKWEVDEVGRFTILMSEDDKTVWCPWV